MTTGPVHVSHSGPSNLVQARYQIDVWAADSKSRAEVAAQVEAALHGAKFVAAGKEAQGSFQQTVGRDVFEEETERFRRVLEFEIFHAAGVFEDALVARLEAQVSLVSNRIYPAPLPQGATLPALTYFRI